jgi:hypothetical protein
MGTTRFRRKRDAVMLTVPAEEAAVLRGLLAQLAEMVAPDEPADPDPLAAMVGIGTATSVPDDPVLARLFPDAYGDDAEAAAEFRRYTETSLRERKRSNAQRAMATLDNPGKEQRLDPETTAAWLGALNDLRLALGTRLGVGEDWAAQYGALAEDDPARVALELYDWLSWLEESLVRCL